MRSLIEVIELGHYHTQHDDNSSGVQGYVVQLKGDGWKGLTVCAKLTSSQPHDATQKSLCDGVTVGLELFRPGGQRREGAEQQQQVPTTRMAVFKCRLQA
jgi:hypothetical protein